MDTPMKCTAALEYLAQRHRLKLSKRSLYNWVRVGVRGVKLEHDTVPNVHPTAKDREVIVFRRDQLDRFLERLGVRHGTPSS